ncbi:hypothetical protein E2C01_045488 [Portunus trituberculatus]|uniref:Uncharacterized protein n=1 Tax=Portunus trituberculatus TaxID=210409 RepID=A0A5B7G261_PORTR|nr:hypothetical protein [Portunus trituberculatus]
MMGVLLFFGPNFTHFMYWCVTLVVITATASIKHGRRTDTMASLSCPAQRSHVTPMRVPECSVWACW